MAHDPTEGSSNGKPAKDDLPDNVKALPLADRAKAMSEDIGDPEDQGELFPDGFLDGDPWTLKQIHTSKKPIDVTARLQGGEVPMRRTGIPDPHRSHRMVVTAEVSKYEPVPVREDDGGGEREIKSWKVRAHLRATYVEPMGEPEDFIKRQFEALVDADRQAATKLAEALTVIAAGGEPVES